MALRDLIEKRSKIAAEMRSINDTPAGEAGDLSETQETRFNELRTDLEAVEKRIQRQTTLDDAERRMAGNPANTGDNFAAEIRSKYSVVRAIAGAAGLSADDGFEREVGQELARRESRSFEGVAVPLEALAPETRTVDGTSGADLIGTDHANEIVDRLRAGTAANRLGVRFVSGLRGDLDIPKLAASSAAGWFADGDTIGESDPGFDKISMKPKHLGARTAFSRTMLLQSVPAVEGIIRGDLTAVLSEALDKAVFVGSGSGNEPTGIHNQTGVNNYETAVSGTISQADVIDLIGALAEANSEASGFAMSPTVAKALRKLEDADGRLLGLLSGIGRSATMENLPVATSTHLPGMATGDKAITAGRFSDVLVGMWGALDLMVNPYGDAYFSKGAVGVRAIMAADIAVRHPEAFATLAIKA